MGKKQPLSFGPRREKTCPPGFMNKKAQTCVHDQRLNIVRSWKVSYLNLLLTKFH